MVDKSQLEMYFVEAYKVRLPPMNEFQESTIWSGNETDYLTPEQRLNAIADILATIALRAVNQDYED